MKYWFSADHHNLHDNVRRYCGRPFVNVNEQQKYFLDEHNSRVHPKDIVYLLGDVSMTRDGADFLLSKMNGQKYFVIGNHDKKFINTIKKYCELVKYIYDIKIHGQKITLCHYMMLTWNCSHYGAWQLHGHCLDLETEILTDSGWKNRNNLLESDKILTLNLNKNELEFNHIENIIDFHDYHGDIYSLKSKGLDLRLTDSHVLIDVVRNKNETFRKFYASEISKLCKRKFPKSAIMKQEYLGIDDNSIKLLVWIAADGNLCNSDLVRINLSKKRKISRIENLLKTMNIQYSKNKHKNNCTCFNFNIPEYLKNIRLKPISNIILHFNKNQLDILLDEYIHTDGYLNNGKLIQIFTSKKIEADLIQITCIKNGYICNISKRENHGFSKKPNYTLTITKKSYRYHDDLKNKISIERSIIGEHFWCVKVPNQTIVIRRNGKHIIVGNCHGNCPPIGLQHDVGVDNNNFKPIEFEEIHEIMKGLKQHHLIENGKEIIKIPHDWNL